jgi:hypothetical protein
MMVAPFAHETWFDRGHFPTDWSFATRGLTLALLGAAVGVALLVRIASRWWPGLDVPVLGRLAPYMPFAVRIHLAVSLLGLLSLGYYLAPSMDLHADVAGILLGAVMVVVTIGMATGWHARSAAALLVLAGPVGMLEFGFWPVLQRVDMLGLAIFVLITGPGRWSADFEQGRARDMTAPEATRGIWALKLAVGGALIVVAFAEKLANPDLARHFLAEHPDFNLARTVGISMSDTTFVQVAGAIEVLFGLLVISGALPQVCVLIAGIPFNATLWFFGTTELVGHLPVYGAMLVLLVFGSDPELRAGVASLWPWRGAPDTPPGGARRSRPVRPGAS